MSRWVILAAVLGAVLAGGCFREQPVGSADQSHGRILRVVATTTQVADFGRNVGGDRVQVTSLLKPNLDAHDYEPSPADVEAIAHADLVLENGAGLETWLHDTITSSGFHGPLVDTSQGIQLRQVGGQLDPHIWQNPRNAQRMVANIDRALAAADPADARIFRANLATYTKQLQALDAEVQRQIDSLANRKLVTNHDAFGYYSDRYGLQFVGSVIPSFDSSAELSGRDIHDLVAKIKATRVKAVFSETSLPPRTAETIAREAGVKVVEGEGALYGDSLGPAGSDGDTYLKMIRPQDDPPQHRHHRAQPQRRLGRPSEQPAEPRAPAWSAPSAAELDRVLVRRADRGHGSDGVDLQRRWGWAGVVVGGDRAGDPAPLDLQPLVAGPWGPVATDNRLEGFGVGGTAEDDEPGQPVAAFLALAGGDEPDQPHPQPSQRLGGVAFRPGDELGHRHRDGAPDRGSQRVEPAVAATWHRRPARHCIGPKRGRLH
jgi:ABC-type Zn uptake system ZnuABC Zn-binding protein ZnuA